MIGQSISHYPAFRDPVRRDKIVEKLGEGGMSSSSWKYDKLIPHIATIYAVEEKHKRFKIV